MTITWTNQHGQVRDLSFKDARLAAGVEFLEYLQKANRRIISVECDNEVNAVFVQDLAGLLEAPSIRKGT